MFWYWVALSNHHVFRYKRTRFISCEPNAINIPARIDFTILAGQIADVEIQYEPVYWILPTAHAWIGMVTAGNFLNGSIWLLMPFLQGKAHHFCNPVTVSRVDRCQQLTGRSAGVESLSRRSRLRPTTIMPLLGDEAEELSFRIPLALRVTAIIGNRHKFAHEPDDLKV